VESETYEHGGIAYRLSVTESDGCYQVRWECPICGVSSDVQGWCDSESHAFDRGQDRLFSDHHLPVHVMADGG